MERKFLVIVLVLAVTLGFSSVSMSRMGGGPGGGLNCVDGDGDGVCDNSGRGGRYGYCTGCVDEDGDGYCDNIFDGTPFTYEGVVISIGYGGSGMVIEETEDAEKIIIYGLGPLWFWDCKNVSRPVVGDVIKISGYTVDYNDIQRNIAVSITIDGVTLELRDPGTGIPLGRGGNRWSCQ